MQEQQSSVLEASMKLLKGERDEQRLAGLLLMTKSCKNDDLASIRSCYDAVGPQFLNRLLMTGMGKGATSSGQADNRDAYLQLSVTFLAVFCRVSEIASSKEMISKIPLILGIMPKQPCSPFLEECYEYLFLVAAASELGVRKLYESGGMNVLASQMPTLPDDSHSFELALKLFQLVISKVSLDLIIREFPSEIVMMVGTIAREFGLLQTAMKFEMLHLLSTILSSKILVPLHDTLRSLRNGWSDYIRFGVTTILINHVVPSEKIHALRLADSMLTIIGEMWLITETKLSDIVEQQRIPPERCLLLVVEISRVEVAVLLNELSYLKYEAPKNPSNAESLALKQRNLAVTFSLIEKIIKIVSNFSETEGCVLSEQNFTNLITGFNETINIALEYLQDARDHNEKRGDDLLAAVRIIGSYLAETPVACKDKVNDLLEYMLTVEGEDEFSSFQSVCFLLPMLCQTTMEIEGCRTLVVCRGYKAVVHCLVKLIEQNQHMVVDNYCLFLACDTIMNILLQREELKFPWDEDTIVLLLKALANWTDHTNDSSDIMMASSICSLLFDSTSEEALLNHPNFGNTTLSSLSTLISRSLSTCWRDISDESKHDKDLLDIVTKGYSRWSNRFPRIKDTVKTR